MAVITAEGLVIPGEEPVFNKNGSVLTLKKISETDWLLFGDLAGGASEGFVSLPSCNINLELTYPWGDEREPGIGFLLQIPVEDADWRYPLSTDDRFQPPLDTLPDDIVLLNYDRDNPSNNYGSLPNGAPSFIKTLALCIDSCSNEVTLYIGYDPGQAGMFRVSWRNTVSGNTAGGIIDAENSENAPVAVWHTGLYLSYSEYSGASICLMMHPMLTS